MKPTLSIFGFSINSYDLMMVIGIALAFFCLWLYNRLAKERRNPFLEWVFLGIFILVGASIGARTLFFITMIPQMHSFDDAIKYAFREGGLVFYGGAIGGFLTGMLYLKLYGHDPARYLDTAFTVLPIGHAIGRIGCFMSGCCYGRLCDAQHGFPFVTLEEGTYALPTQLYEAGFLALLFGVLSLTFFLYRKRQPYFQTGLCFVAYGLWRFIIEFFRGDAIRGVFLLSTSQWISLVVIAFGILFLCGVFGRMNLFKQTKGWYRRKGEINHVPHS